MREYESVIHDELYCKIHEQKEFYIEVDFKESDFLPLQYYLTRKYYFATVVDNYLHKISVREELLEAIYYQARLITVHSMSWDAFHEGLNDLVNNGLEFDGICLLFMQKGLSIKLAVEFKNLKEVIFEINKTNKKKVFAILNK